MTQSQKYRTYFKPNMSILISRYGRRSIQSKYFSRSVVKCLPNQFTAITFERRFQSPVSLNRNAHSTNRPFPWDSGAIAIICRYHVLSGSCGWIPFLRKPCTSAWCAPSTYSTPQRCFGGGKYPITTNTLHGSDDLQLDRTGPRPSAYQWDRLWTTSSGATGLAVCLEGASTQRQLSFLVFRWRKVSSNVPRPLLYDHPKRYRRATQNVPTCANCSSP